MRSTGDRRDQVARFRLAGTRVAAHEENRAGDDRRAFGRGSRGAPRGREMESPGSSKRCMDRRRAHHCRSRYATNDRVNRGLQGLSRTKSSNPQRLGHRGSIEDITPCSTNGPTHFFLGNPLHDQQRGSLVSDTPGECEWSSRATVTPRYTTLKEWVGHRQLRSPRDERERTRCTAHVKRI